MKHDWYPASGGGLIATLWTGNPIKVALLNASYVPNPDTHKVWGDVSPFEVSGSAYTAGGQPLTGKTASYDAAADRTNLLANDSTWGPGASFATRYGVVYDDSGGKPLWSLVDYEALKDIINGVFTIDWAASGALYVTKV